ncbi:MAG: hypothetical protein VZQ98_06755 [Bacteroidales bacterium]|nr:hypothetical protein [Bacteroidales bacterium]
MKRTYLLFLFFICFIHQDLLSQAANQYQSVKQNYEGKIFVPFYMEQLSKISQLDDKTIHINHVNSKQTDVIKLSKGKILKIHRANDNTSGVASAKQKIFALTIQLPVAKDSFCIEIQGKTSTTKRYLITGEEESIELHYFDNQGNSQKLGLDNLTKEKMRNAIDRSKPITLHVINYKGKQYEVTETDVQNFHVMHTTRPATGKGNQLTSDQIKRIIEAFSRKENFFLIISYQDEKGKKGGKTVEINPQYAWVFSNP